MGTIDDKGDLRVISSRAGEPDAGVAAVVPLRRSFDDFYRAERSGVVSLAWALCGSWWAAEELAQDAFVAAHGRWDTISGYGDPGAWVRRVVSNRSVSLLRRRAAEARALSRLRGQPKPPQPEMRPVDEEFWRSVRSLPERQAQAVALHYLEDRSVQDIAEVLGCAAATVKVHLHRGRQTLAQKLGCTIDEEEA